MEPIAVVGMASRLPGAASLEEYWALLRAGRWAVEPVPAERWNASQLFDEDAKSPGKSNSRLGGFIKNVEMFDAAFFGISPREAAQLDPQQRLLLEVAYEAMEDAGLSPKQLAGSDTAVFTGLMSNDYLQRQIADSYRNIDVHTGAGAGYSMTANRISYQFDLRGPSMALDSACSSSLTTAFLGCQSLWMNQCSVALVGGVNLMLSPAFNIFYTKGGLSAKDGKCKTFSAAADGLVRGEGAGIVVLKRLSDAQRDNDRVYAVIRGGAINHNGRSNGINSPSRWAQEDLLRKAYHHAEISPKDVQYVEIHGTGTLIGDPIEANALGTILGIGRAKDRPCLIGSVKTNIGHLEGAAGVAGLIKLVLQLHHRKLAPSLWFDEPNPHISFETLPLKVQTEPADWQVSEGVRRMGGVSAFGLGGANAHLVLEEAPAYVRHEPVQNPSALMLSFSARTKQALYELAEKYQLFLSTADEAQAMDICATSALRRDRHEWRAAVVAPDLETLIDRLAGVSSGSTTDGVYQGTFSQAARRVVRFVYPHVERIDAISILRLSSRFSSFREEWKRLDQVLEQRLQQPHTSLWERLQRGVSTSDPDFSLLHFAVQLGLAAVWKAAGIVPTSATGNGLGQVAADCAFAPVEILDAQLLEFAIAANLRGETSEAKQKTLSPVTEDDSYSASTINAPAANEAILFLSGDGSLSGLVGSSELLLGFEHLVASLSCVHNIHWTVAFAERHHFVPLPSYPWQRSRHWLEVPEEKSQPILQPDPAQAEVLNSGNTLNREMLTALSDGERDAALTQYLIEIVSKSLFIPKEELDANSPLNSLGMDSLVAVEIRNRVDREFSISLPIVRFLDGYSIHDFVGYILREVQSPATQTNSIAATQSRPFEEIEADIWTQVEALSEDKIEAMLERMMLESTRS